MPRSNRPVELRRDHARPRTMPAPTASQLETHLQLLLHPAAFGMRERYRANGMRERILSLPVMVGILLSLVWRQIASVSELQRVLARESLLWVEPTEVSQQAISKRLATLPPELFAGIWDALSPVLQQRAVQRPSAHADLLAQLPPDLARVWILDSSRLEAVFKKSKALRGVERTVLGGTLISVLDLASHLPVRVWVNESATVSDRKILDPVLETVPAGTILVLDRGFSRYSFFDALTENGSVLISQWSQQWAGEVVQTHRRTATEQDQIVRVGKYRSNRCRHPLRRIGRLQSDGQWHYWMTTELDPGRLSADQVITLYAQRWRIEETFLHCKRLLNLSYLWGSSANAIALQVWTTILLYGVLIDLCAEIAHQFELPVERISVEMVYRSTYHYARAVQGGEQRAFVAWACDAAQRDLGIVKRVRHPPHPALSQGKDH